MQGVPASEVLVEFIGALEGYASILSKSSPTGASASAAEAPSGETQ